MRANRPHMSAILNDSDRTKPQRHRGTETQRHGDTETRIVATTKTRRTRRSDAGVGEVARSGAAAPPAIRRSPTPVSRLLRTQASVTVRTRPRPTRTASAVPPHSCLIERGTLSNESGEAARFEARAAAAQLPRRTLASGAVGRASDPTPGGRDLSGQSRAPHDAFVSWVFVGATRPISVSLGASRFVPCDGSASSA